MALRISYGPRRVPAVKAIESLSGLWEQRGPVKDRGESARRWATAAGPRATLAAWRELQVDHLRRCAGSPLRRPGRYAKQEPSVRGDGPHVSRGIARAWGRRRRPAERARTAVLNLRAELEIDHHVPVVERAVEELGAVPAPTRLAAALGRHLLLQVGRRKRDHVHLKSARLVLIRRVRQPLPVLRELRLVLLVVALHDRKRLARFEAIKRQRADVLEGVLPALKGDVLPVPRPVL